MKIINQSNNTVVAQRADLADTFWTRMAGLIPRRALPGDEALILTRCQSIHMFFMRFSIDVIFTDRRRRVVGLVENIKPFQLSRIYWKAYFAIELAAGTIGAKKVSLGDQLEF